MDEVKVVIAHSERATLRVGDVFLKVDSDRARIDAEVKAMSLAPVPTPKVLWRKPNVLAIAALPVDDPWTPRRAVDRVGDGVGRGRRRHSEVARCAAAALARPGWPEHQRTDGGARRRV